MGNEIAPLALDKMPALTAQVSLDAVKAEMRRMHWCCRAARPLSFNALRQTMCDIARKLDQEQQQLSLCVSRMLLDADEFAMQSYSRVYSKTEEFQERAAQG